LNPRNFNVLLHVSTCHVYLCCVVLSAVQTCGGPVPVSAAEREQPTLPYHAGACDEGGQTWPRWCTHRSLTVHTRLVDTGVLLLVVRGKCRSSNAPAGTFPQLQPRVPHIITTCCAIHQVLSRLAPHTCMQPRTHHYMHDCKLVHLGMHAYTPNESSVGHTL
jgi:hypothetical protein